MFSINVVSFKLDTNYDLIIIMNLKLILKIVQLTKFFPEIGFTTVLISTVLLDSNALQRNKQEQTIDNELIKQLDSDL